MVAVKNYVACTLGNNACQQGYSVQYWRRSRLLGELMHSRADGSYRKQLTLLLKTQLLILDDWGLSLSRRLIATICWN
nr:ATP-binding protein [Citrobacter braakii]